MTEIGAPDVTYFDHRAPQQLNGVEALKAEYANIEGKIHYEVTHSIDPRVQLYGDMAVLTCRFFSTRLNPDGPISRSTPWNCSGVFVRADGSWRVIPAHGSYILGEIM